MLALLVVRPDVDAVSVRDATTKAGHAGSGLDDHVQYGPCVDFSVECGVWGVNHQGLPGFRHQCSMRQL